MPTGFLRTLQSIRRIGLKEYWHQLQYIGDTKAGTLIGTDKFGNRYFENPEEYWGRHRWVDYAQDDFNSSQVPPEWHGWLHSIRTDPPQSDPRITHPKYEQAWHENLTGSRGAFKTYSTTAPKYRAWEPQVKQRGL